VKLATPDTAWTISPPTLEQLSTPADGFVPMASVTLDELSFVSTMPFASSIATETENVPVPVAWMFCPVDGWAWKTSFASAVVAAVKAGPGGLTQLVSSASTSYL
jgi:hypothetical protein